MSQKQTPHRHQLEVFIFREFCKGYLQHLGQAIHLWRSTYIIATDWEFQWFPWDSFEKNSNNCNPGPVLKALLGNMRYPVRALSSLLFGNFIQTTFIYIMYQETSTVLIFYITHQMSLNCSCLSLYSFPHLFQAFHSTLISLVSVPHSINNYLFYFCFLGR